MTYRWIFFLSSFLFVSCKPHKKFGEHETVIDNGEVEIHWYEVPEMYQPEEVVSVVKGDSTIHVLRKELGLPLGDVTLADPKRIIIRTLPNFHWKQFRNRAFGYEIILDTSISMKEWKQKVAERDRYR